MPKAIDVGQDLGEEEARAKRVGSTEAQGIVLKPKNRPVSGSMLGRAGSIPSSTSSS